MQSGVEMSLKSRVKNKECIGISINHDNSLCIWYQFHYYSYYDNLLIFLINIYHLCLSLSDSHIANYIARRNKNSSSIHRQNIASYRKATKHKTHDFRPRKYLVDVILSFADCQLKKSQPKFTITITNNLKGYRRHVMQHDIQSKTPFE